jgi:hypothetical protein
MKLHNLLRSEALSFVAITIFMVMGVLQVSIWPAIIGGALFGAPGLAQLMLLKRDYPSVPTSWRLIGFYGEAILHGVGAGVAGYFVGYGIRAYWGVP